MKYFYFVHYTIGGFDGMIAYETKGEINNFFHIEEMSGSIKREHYRSERGAVIITNWKLLRTEGRE